jgi:RNA polymerase sigma-70 factor (ECF subfamily)
MAAPAGDPLLEGLAAGCEEAYAALYDQFGAVLFRVARTLLGSCQDAEDAVQEVFVGLVRARQSLGNVANLRAYLFSSLRRAAARLDSERNGRLTVRFAEIGDIAAPIGCSRVTDEAVQLELALHGLPFEQREVVALKIDGGLTFAEIGAELGVSVNTAASRYRYALEKLRAALEKYR